MLRERLLERQQTYERRLRDLSYERAALQARIAEMDRALSELSGALYEVANVLRDLDTEAAIQAAEHLKQKQENGGRPDG